MYFEADQIVSHTEITDTTILIEKLSVVMHMIRRKGIWICASHGVSGSNAARISSIPFQLLGDRGESRCDIKRGLAVNIISFCGLLPSSQAVSLILKYMMGASRCHNTTTTKYRIPARLHDDDALFWAYFDCGFDMLLCKGVYNHRTLWNPLMCKTQFQSR